MASEAAKIKLLGNQGDPVEFVINCGSAIPKGSLMYLISGTGLAAQTISISSAGSQFFMGVASEEHVSGTNATSGLACWTHGLFEMTTGGNDTVAFGAPCCTSDAGANLIGSASENEIEGSAKVVGISQELITAGGRGAVLINVGRTY